MAITQSGPVPISVEHLGLKKSWMGVSSLLEDGGGVGLNGRTDSPLSLNACLSKWEYLPLKMTGQACLTQLREEGDRIGNTKEHTVSIYVLCIAGGYH